MAENKATTPYAPLPPNDSSATRLVKLLPAGFHDPNRCELETVSLENEPPYIALSYVWGDATDTVPISLNGIQHDVTRNLDSFLRHFQALLKEVFLVLQCLPVICWPSGIQIIEALNSLATPLQDSEDLAETAEVAMLYYFVSIGDRTALNKLHMERSGTGRIAKWNDSSLPRFWIDALCINQKDPVERNKQVKRMDHIYRQTYLLLVWGMDHQQPKVSEEVTEAFFRYIERLCEHLGFKTIPITFESDVCDAVQNAFTVQRLRINEFLTVAAVRLFDLEWFCRAWVFQEVALSASKPSEMWTGFKHISLPKLFIAGIEALKVSANLDPEKTIIIRGCLSRAVRTLRALTLDKSLVDSGQNSLHSVHPASNLHICRRLIYLLSDGSQNSMTDPRDAIYSLYGLLSTSRLPAAIEPDYTKSVSDVYHSVASFLLSHMGIDILGFLLSPTRGMDGCPSWVPDFSCLRRYDSLALQYPSASMTYRYRITNELLSIEEGSPHDDTATHEIEHSSTILRISCPIYWLQTIERVVYLEQDWAYPELQDEHSLEDIVSNIGLLLRAVSSSVLDTIQCATQASMDNSFETWASFLKRFSGHTLREYEAVSRDISKATDEYAGLFDAFATETLLNSMIDRILERSSLGITGDGHLILGRKLNRLEKHDRIGFIPNSRETFIFRPCDSGYQFITSCWQSDTPELIEVESLQLGDKETITMI